MMFPSPIRRLLPGLEVDQRALILIQFALSEESMVVALEHSSARFVWTSLEAAYSHDSVERMQTHRDSLRQLTKGTSSIAKYGWKFKYHYDQLSAIGHPIYDADKCNWFLWGIDASFENYSTSKRAINAYPSFF